MRESIVTASILGLLFVTLPVSGRGTLSGSTAPTASVTASIVLPGGTSVIEGNPFIVEIRLDTNSQEVTAGQVELSMSDSVSFVRGINDTGAGTWTSGPGNVEPFLIRGNVALAVTSLGASPVNGSNVLVATLTCVASAAAPSPAELTLQIFDGRGGTVFIAGVTTPYTTDLNNASVTITASTQTAAPATTTRTPLRTPSALCPCDCDEDGVVFVNELVRAVDIALTDDGLFACDAADRNLDGTVSVDELVAGVRAGLDGC